MISMALWVSRVTIDVLEYVFFFFKLRQFNIQILNFCKIKLQDLETNIEHLKL